VGLLRGSHATDIFAGKSSLINSLLDIENLAKTVSQSSTASTRNDLTWIGWSWKSLHDSCDRISEKARE
jgi:mevalonate pyrophosphate decarboxylase